MALEPATQTFIDQVKKAVLAQQKPGFFTRLFSKESQDGGLSGLQIRDFSFGEALGSGACGVVYAAVDAEGKAVAVKVLPKPLKEDEAAKALFDREIKVGQTIDHPAVVKTLDWFEVAPARFVVMDKVDGVTLDKYLTGKLEPAKFVELFGSLVQGLQAAHDKGVVHRDLKPENVMVTKDEQIKILDFGMARVQQDVSVTATGTFKGTLHYTSPEQISDSKRVGAASDQFAFGLMCFEALSGQSAFHVDPKKPMEAIMGRIECNPKTLLEVEPDLGQAPSQVIARMLMPQPEDRYPSVTEGFEALKSALGHQ